MKLGGYLRRSWGYPMDDPPVMVYSALRHALEACERAGVEPVGALSMHLELTNVGFDDDMALVWEFTPDHRPTPGR